jgi:hypothetical protein
MFENDTQDYQSALVPTKDNQVLEVQQNINN